MPRLQTVAGTSADPLVQFEKLEIDGQTYHLAYDFNAIAEAEKLVGCNLLEGIAAILMHGMTAEQFRGLFYAALRKARPKMTLEQAGSLVRIDTMPDIREALLRAYNASLPEAKKILDPPEAGVEKVATGDLATVKSGSSAGPPG